MDEFDKDKYIDKDEDKSKDKHKHKYKDKDKDKDSKAPKVGEAKKPKTFDQLIKDLYFNSKSVVTIWSFKSILLLVNLSSWDFRICELCRIHKSRDLEIFFYFYNFFNIVWIYCWLISLNINVDF